MRIKEERQGRGLQGDVLVSSLGTRVGGGEKIRGGSVLGLEEEETTWDYAPITGVPFLAALSRTSAPSHLSDPPRNTSLSFPVLFPPHTTTRRVPLMPTAVPALQGAHTSGFVLTRRCQQGEGPMEAGTGWQQGEGGAGS